jgi:hypothetical protein
MKNQTKHVLRGLALGNGKFLLAVALVKKESKLIHMNLSWLLGGGDMVRTNVEKRPLAQLCGMNTNNEILLFVNAFMPSAQTWVFYWLWTDTCPYLLDSDALKLTKMIFVDKNENNWIALTSNLLPNNKQHGNALVRLFHWHTNNRNLVNTLVALLLTPADTAFCDDIVNWLYAFNKSIKKY